MRQVKLEITTPHGDRYIIHADGNIERTDLPGFKCSGQWKLIALKHVARREIIPLDMLLAGKLPAPLLYKNGSPQWTVRDLDHGSTREWGNTKHHGVKSIRVLAE
jgi:hypothetical protein